MKRHYYPRLSEATIREILARNGDSFWTAFARLAPDREFVAGWLLSGMIDWETGTWTMPRDAGEADRLAGGDKVDETLSWLVAADRLARENGIQFAVALIPVGLVDPAYVDFWRPWPKYFSYTLSRPMPVIAASRRRCARPACRSSTCVTISRASPAPIV